MKRIQYISFFILGLIIVFSCKNSTGDQDVDNTSLATDERIFISKEQFNQSKMVLGQREEKSFPTQIHTSGMIDVPPENRAVVSAMTGGFIKTTPLLIGDKVRKGQALVTLENPEFIQLQQEYLEVSAQLTYLKSESERQQIMLSENITSEKNFLKAESAYNSAKAIVNGLAKQLKILNISPSKVTNESITSISTIYAPIDGSITKINVSKGMHVSPATEILEIVNNDHVHIELSVFEKDIMKVKKDQHITFKIPEVSSKVYKAEIYLVGTAIEENRTIKIHSHLHNDEKQNFLKGMFVEADIITSSSTQMALVSSAIVDVEGKFSVLKLVEQNENGYYFLQIPITTGLTHDGFTAVEPMNNMNEKDQFLVEGAFSLISE